MGINILGYRVCEAMNNYSLNTPINNPYRHQTGMPNNSYDLANSVNVYRKPLTEEEKAALKEKNDNILKYSLILPVFYVIKKGADAFDNACKGEYENSLSYKMGKLGDKISNSKFAKSAFVQKISEFNANIKNRFRNFVDTHEVTKTIKETPTIPESKMVNGFLKTQEEEIVSEFTSTANEFLNGTDKLKKLNLNQNEIDFLKNRYNVENVRKLNQNRRAIQDVEFLRFGEDSLNNIDKIERRIETIKPNLESKLQSLISDLDKAKNEEEVLKLNGKIQKLSEVVDGSFINNMRADKLKALKKEAMSVNGISADTILHAPEKHVNEIIEICKRNGAKACGKKNSFDIFGNKLRSMTEPTSNLGKLLPKAAYTGMRGLVFTGGALAILAFVAPGIAQTIVDTKNAEKGKKTATFAHGFMEAISWVISIPIAVKSMFGLGGLKYLGQDKAQVQKYRDELKIFNNKAENSLFANKAEYDAALSNLNSLKETKDLSLGKKILKKAGSIMMVGHETPKPYKEAGRSLGNFVRKMPYYLKEGAAYPVRLGLYMFAFAPIVDKVLSGMCRLVFGKPDEKVLEKQEPKAPQITNRIPISDGNDYSTLSDSNLVKQAINSYTDK